MVASECSGLEYVTWIANFVEGYRICTCICRTLDDYIHVGSKLREHASACMDHCHTHQPSAELTMGDL